MNTISQALQKYNSQFTNPAIENELYCNGVVNPITKETITHYRQLIKDPLLRTFGPQP
jgi:hypothetical protein